MDSTSSVASQQESCWIPVCDTFTTPDEAYEYGLGTAMPMLAGGDPIPGCEAFFPPEPLPEKFFARLAASVAAEPRSYGRVFRHGLDSTKGGRNGRPQ